MGYDPSTVTSVHSSLNALSILLILGSSIWPSKSAKKMYSFFAIREGKD
jgi:hypothetical protein